MFFRIIIEVILPVFILIGLGYLMDRLFTLDLPTLNQILFNILIPVIVFQSIVATELDPDQLGIVAGFTLISTVAMWLAGMALFSFGKLRETRFESIFSLLFTNTGNFGIPVMLIAFGEVGVSVISIMMITGTVIYFTIGLIAADKTKADPIDIAKRILTNTSIIALALGFIIRVAGWSLPAPLQIPLDYIQGAFVAIALLTLGTQIGRIKIGEKVTAVLATTAARLLGGPALAALLLALMGVNGDLRSMLIVGSGMPAAIINFIVMAKNDRDSAFTSEIILVTTLVASITVPFVILCCGGIN